MSNELSHYIKKIQQDLHAIPEPAFHEFKTAAYIEKELKSLGYTVHTGIAGTGVTATLTGKRDRPCIGVRADMDCIKHEDDGRLFYRHSCGHDAHSSIALGIARLFSEKKKEMNGSVKFIFQPAEEIMQGAKAMVHEGVLEDVDSLIGYHLRTATECPTGSMSPALMHSAGTILTGKIQGKTAHGGRPHLGVNVIDVFGALINSVNAIRPNPQTGTSVKFTSFAAGGGSFNVIPGSASFAIDVRSRDNEELKRVLENIDRIIHHTGSMYDAYITYQVEGGVPAPRYSKRLIQEAQFAIESVLGKGKAISPIVTPGGEDFHYYTKLTDIEAVYLGIGANVSPGLHDPSMTFDHHSLVEASLVISHLVNQLHNKQ
ncbi:amidohydrolase [Pseudalkalibacillus hwajinpoensis]|uniref:Amidohydrolase n=1 Tax=Guptibacillus hwajinpoensis TaxID=208199 RepID=A0A4U1MLA4_9BACL|nr:amidohydrolase [Pseudalkalibacillus hwajinpoensis]TKD71312.1 amidohydrolase [Pseudalkalibacillus hwajinpoensis]